MKYQVDEPISKKIKEREAIVGSNYFQAIANLINSCITSGHCERDDELLINSAISFTDKLIQKVGEKL